MPSGRVHTTTTLILAVGSLVVAEPALTVGILSGLILSPDQDVDGGFIGMSHLRHIPVVGKMVSKCWQWFWWPYSKLVPHRSHISHSIFFGTCARVGYLIIPLLAVNYLGLPMKLPTDTGQWFLGLCLADALHIILDNTVKGK